VGKSPFISKGTFSPDDAFEKGFEEQRAGREIPIRDKERLVATARKVRATMETPGWKEEIGPFLEHHGNPAKVFDFFGIDSKKKKMTEEDVMLCKAFWQLLNYVNNLVGLGDRLAIDLIRKGERPSKK